MICFNSEGMAVTPTGTVTVASAVTPTSTPAKTNWGLLLGFVALVAVSIIIFGEK